MNPPQVYMWLLYWKQSLSPPGYCVIFVAPYHGLKLKCLLSCFLICLPLLECKLLTTAFPMSRITQCIFIQWMSFTTDFSSPLKLLISFILGDLHSDIPFLFKTKPQNWAINPPFSHPKSQDTFCLTAFAYCSLCLQPPRCFSFHRKCSALRMVVFDFHQIQCYFSERASLITMIKKSVIIFCQNNLDFFLFPY